VFSGGPSSGAAEPRTSRAGGTRLIMSGVLACAVAVTFYFVSFFAHPLHMGLNWFDFRV